jgi:hypothetical protein
MNSYFQYDKSYMKFCFRKDKVFKNFNQKLKIYIESKE